MVERIGRLLIDAIDYGLELSIVGSFSSIGVSVRARLHAWQPLPAGAMDGRTAVVTGPTSGLGLATAEALATCGARVVLVGRTRAKLEKLSARLAARTGRDSFPIQVVDMSSLASVRDGVQRILATEERVDVLVDNAGAIYQQRTVTADGLEQTLAILVVGPFVLTSGLMPLLEASDDGRVIAVTTGGIYAQPVDLDDLQWRSRTYNGTRAYAQAKRIQVALMRERARRSLRSTVSFNAVHPGWADTPGLVDALPGFHRLMGPLLRTVEQGADTVVWLAASPDVPRPDGKLYLDRRPRPFDRIPATRLSAVDREWLLDTVSELATRGA